ncbi:unnamed protein product [Clavelina lepadiformis]|uniref:Fanconi-associated nuclease n=1 Tax=Clavelina lepadiformis TaxID=159417 RepID=A0ABP0FT13_CLALP
MKRTISNYFNENSVHQKQNPKKRKKGLQKDGDVFPLLKKEDNSVDNDIIVISDDEKEKKEKSESLPKTSSFLKKTEEIKNLAPLFYKRSHGKSLINDANESSKENNYGIKVTKDTKDNSKNVTQSKEDVDVSINTDSNNKGIQIPYHLQNFKLVIETVTNNSDDSRLFEGDDNTIIKAFQELGLPAQSLYVRLFHRKPSWLQLGKISYQEIAEDIVPVLNVLVEKKFVLCSQSEEDIPFALPQVFTLLPAQDMKTLGKSLHIPVSGTKEKISASILKLCKEQKSVLSLSNSLKNVVMSRAMKLLGPCYKIADNPKQTFNRLLLVFDVTRGTEDDSEYSLNGSNQPPYYGRHQQLSTVMMTGMGRVVYPKSDIYRPTPVFETRNELLEYEAAYHLYADVMNASEASDWKLALDVCKTARNTSKTLSEKSKQRAIALPQFMCSYTASAIYTRIQSLEVELLQRTKKYKEASDLLRKLIAQEHFACSRRGYWYERLALNLEQHLGKPHDAYEVIKQGLSDRYVRVGHVISLVERLEKIKSSKKAKGYDFKELLNQHSFKTASEVTIVGRLLPKRMQTGKARFMRQSHEHVADSDDVLLCSVEELVLAHYRSVGYDQGIHGEGGTFACFFCLLMWDIIFMSGIDDVFRTPYQSHPLDYNTDEFYENRKEAIEKRLNEISQWECDGFNAPEMIRDTWEANKDVNCAGMNWDRFSSAHQAVTLAQCMGGQLVAGILRIIARDPRHTRSGLPDLAVWKSDTSDYKLVEVKGPGDRLSNNQKVWMHELVTLAANVEVCHVTANASRKLAK